MRRTFWKRDWFLGLVVSVGFFLAAGTPAFQALERVVYDWGVQAAEAEPSDRVVVIAIDDDSIADLGRWPWSRDLHARMIDLLEGAGARTIGYTVLFLEPQIDPGLVHVEGLLDYYRDAGLGNLPGLLADDADEALRENVRERLAGLEFRLQSALTDLDTDADLAASIGRSENVVLGMPFSLGVPRGNPDQPLSDAVRSNALGTVEGDVQGRRFIGLPARDAIPPIAPLDDVAAGIGHLNHRADVDGSVRSEALIVDHFGDLYPSLSLRVVARSLNLEPEDIVVRPGRGIRAGGLEIDTDPNLEMKTFFYDQDSIPVESFHEVLSGRVSADRFADRIVLVGATATGVGNSQVTPVTASSPPVMTLAHAVSSLLEEDFFTRPDWAEWAEYGAWALITLFLIAAVPALSAGLAALGAGLLFGGLIVGELGLIVSEAYWVQLAGPAALMVVGYTLLMTKRYLATEKGKEKSDAESAESNRMLGLSFQSQGQLDTAFEKYRKCPLDDSMMEVLYNLALDYERKRQFNKAGNVYDYMAKHDPKFRDLPERRKRSKAMEETVVLGGGGSSGGGTLVLEGGGVEKPKLGRYDVERELGKGAMGTVYLGRDPKINRVVAIKTLALSQEFEPDELEDVRERFFREAETAGRLSHPNIVTIYDAGEEHDLAYISMEFLEGTDLTGFTKADGLLPLDRVLELIAQAADALAFAHQHNVVHRDIKPGNIMYEDSSGKIKITDFGIARITDSSRTKTGMVLGTPSYMSPEQIAGKKVDGRSDLFSLGVMLYQMTTGRLPFKADSMATLMYQIANEPHPEPISVQPDLPACVQAIINRALEKDPDARYSDGAEMARELRDCAAGRSNSE